MSIIRRLLSALTLCAMLTTSMGISSFAEAPQVTDSPAPTVLNLDEISDTPEPESQEESDVQTVQAEPSETPTTEPSTEASPESSPETSSEPTAEPENDSTAAPDTEPSTEPVPGDTDAPAESAEPSQEPDADASAVPSEEPGEETTVEPSTEPDADTSAEPSEEPGEEATAEPTAAPEESPEPEDDNKYVSDWSPETAPWDDVPCVSIEDDPAAFHTVYTAKDLAEFMDMDMADLAYCLNMDETALSALSPEEIAACQKELIEANEGIAANSGSLSLGVKVSGTAYSYSTQDYSIYISRSGRYLLTLTGSKYIEAKVYNGNTYIDGVGHACNGYYTNWTVDLEAGKTYTFKINVDSRYSSGYCSFSALLNLYIDGSYADRAEPLAYDVYSNYNVEYSNDYQIFCFTTTEGSKYRISSTGSMYRFIEICDSNFNVIAESSKDISGNVYSDITLSKNRVYYICIHGRDYYANDEWWFRTGSGKIKIECLDKNAETVTFTKSKSTVNPGMADSITFNVSSRYATKVRVLADGQYIGTEHTLSGGKVSFSQSFHVSGTRSIQIQGYYNGSWSLLSSPQTITVNHMASLGTPVLSSVINNQGIAYRNNNYTLVWHSLSNAVRYSVYVYSGNEQIYKTEVTDTQAVIPANIFSTLGIYYIDVYGIANVGQQSSSAARATITVQEYNSANRLSIASIDHTASSNLITWNVKAKNASRNAQYKFTLYKSGFGKIHSTNYTAASSFSYSASEVGSYYVVASVIDNGIVVEATSSAVSVSVSALTIKGNSSLLVKKTTKLVVTNSQGKTVSNSKLTWSSSDSSVAKVDKKGVVTAKAIGSAIITAVSKEGYMGSFAVRVFPSPKSVAIRLNGTAIKNGSTVKVYLHEAPRLEAVVSPADAYQAVTWKSSNSCVKIDAAGNISPKKEGTSTITATAANGKKASIKVKIVDMYKPTGVVLSESGTVKLNMGSTLYLNATMQPATATRKLTWSSSSKSVATVDSNGCVTPKKEGTVTITVKTHNGKKDTVKVKVVDPYKPTGVVLSHSGTVNLNMYSSLYLDATMQPATATRKLTWSSSKKSVATVDSNGCVTPIKEGTVTITVKTHNGKKDTVKVKVVDPYKPTRVVLNDSGTITLAMGDSYNLGCSLEPSTARSKLTWSSSKKSVATVDANGKVTAVKAGSATITVKTHNGKKDTVKIQVKKYYPVQKLELLSGNSSYGELYVGNSIKLKVKYTPKESVDFASLSWSSSDTSVATVSSNGTVTAVGAGYALITARDRNTGVEGSFGLVATRQSRYRAIVVVENTYVTINNYYKRLLKRTADRDGYKKIMNTQNFDGRKVESIADLSGLSKTTLLSNLQSLPSQWNISEDDVTYFFFNGHGCPDGSLVLFANGAENQYIYPNELKKALSAIPGKVVVFIGSCYSGSYIYDNYGTNSADAEIEDPASFTSAIIEAFSDGDSLPIVAMDDSGSEIPFTDESSDEWIDSGVMSNRGELRQSKFYVLTAAAYNQESWFRYYYNSSKNIIEKDSFGLFERAVCRAAGYDYISKKTTWSSGTKTLHQVYTSVQKQVDDYRKSFGGNIKPQSIQVYPRNSNFVIFMK